MPVIDVFIALKMYNIGRENGKDVFKPERPEGIREGFPIPDWYGLQKDILRFGTHINIYEEELRNCNKHTFLQSLLSPGRIVVFIGHGWTDSRNRKGRDEPGFGVRIRDGQYFGTFGITQSMTNPKTGMNYGDYTPIPIIKASRVFFLTCNPGPDFPDILKKIFKAWFGCLLYLCRTG